MTARSNSCAVKTRYESKTAAGKAMRGRDSRKRGKRGKQGDERPLDIYRCQFCGGWHIGHRPASGKS